jgi:hypothetical protein
MKSFFVVYKGDFVHKITKKLVFSYLHNCILVGVIRLGAPYNFIKIGNSYCVILL